MWTHQTKIHLDEAEFFNRDLTDHDLKFECKNCDKRFLTKKIVEYVERRDDDLSSNCSSKSGFVFHGSLKKTQLPRMCTICDEKFIRLGKASKIKKCETWAFG